MEQLHSTSLVFLLLRSIVCDAQKIKRDDDSAVHYVNFVPSPFRKLSSVVLSSLEVSGPSECAFECLDNQNCHSVNFGAVALDGGRHRCELLSGDMFFRDKANFIAHGNFHHYNIKAGLSSSIINLLHFSFAIANTNIMINLSNLIHTWHFPPFHFFLC